MAGPSDTIEISYEQLSTGKFIRDGSDLTITTNNLFGESETVLLKNYFLTSPDLVTTKGSILKGNIVNLLAINSQPLDQTYVAFEDPQAIGKITIADGPVVVQRADQLIELQVGDFIYLNDVIEAKTGSVGIAFADETTLSVDAGSKMVVDEFVYDPENPTTGSMNANIITGNFSFVSGQIAKVGNDAMTVTTPVLTIGVRGTQVAGKASQEGEANEIVLLPNEDGTVGQILVSNQSGTVLLTKAFESTTITSSFMPPTVPVILPEEIVLKKFGTTINTTRRTEKKAEEEREESENEEEKEEDEEEKDEEEKEEETEEDTEEEVEDPFEEEISEEELENLEDEVAEETAPVEEETPIEDDIFTEEPIVEEKEDQPVVEEQPIVEDTPTEDTQTEDTQTEEPEVEEEPVIESEPIIEDTYVPPPPPPPVTDPIVDTPVVAPPPVTYEPEPEPEPYVPPPTEEEEDPPEVNEAPTFNTTTAVSVAESLSNGSTVATMSATDPNTDTSLNTLTYSITAGNDEGKFTINSSTGVISYSTQAATLTTETFESFSNGATATGWTGDNGVYDTNKWTTVLGKINGNINSEQDVYKTFDFSETYAGKRVAIDFLFWEWGTWDAHNYNPDGGTEQFRVYVNDTNVVADDRRKDGFGAGDKKYGVETQSTGWDPVQDGSIYGDEEGELYTVYGTLDDDGDLKLGFGVRVGEGINNESGSIDNLKIHLTDLNYEDNQQYVLTVQASDGSLSATTTQTINVTDVNEAPRTEDARDPVTVAENVADNTNIASIFAEDPDGDDVTYSITAGNDEGKFTITYYNSTNSGLIETNGSLDYETTTQYTLTITATDEHGLTATTTQVINVSDIDEATQYSKSMNYGTLATWGGKYNEDMMINNAWTNPKVLLLGEFNSGNSEHVEDIFESVASGSNYPSWTVTDGGNNWGTIDSYTKVQLSDYAVVVDLTVDNRHGDGAGGNSSSYTKTITDDDAVAYKDVLQLGGTLYMQGENINWDSPSTDANPVLQAFVRTIDSDVDQNNDIFGGTGSNTQVMQPGTNGEYIQYSMNDLWENYALDSDDTYAMPGTNNHGSGSTGYEPAPGKLTASKLGGGKLMVTHDSNTDYGHLAEWGGNELNSGYTGSYLMHLGGNSSKSNYSGSNNGGLNFGQYWGDLIHFMYDENKKNTYDNGDVAITTDYIPLYSPYYGSTTWGPQVLDAADSPILEVDNYHLGNNVYIGGGMGHIDFVWDDAQITVASTENGYNVSSQETGPRELAFSSDGTKFFVTGYQDGDVGEYSMSTAWDVSTASYTDAFSVGTQTGTGAHGLAFNADGTKMFVLSYGSDQVHEYALSTGFDVSTASYTDGFSVSSQDSNPRGLAFNTDGTKMFVTGDDGNDINEYTLSTGFDVSTASFVDSLDVSSYDTSVRGVTFNDDGTRMFYHGQQNDKIHDFSLSTAFDVSTASYNTKISLPSFDTGAEAIVFNGDGNKLFVTGNDYNTIDEYTLTGGWDDVDAPYWAFNTDNDGTISNPVTGTTWTGPVDDHYGVISVDADGDGDLFETTDTFSLDKIFIKDDSENFLVQDSDATGDYYLRIYPVTYSGGSWDVEESNGVVVSNTTGYNDYLDLSSNTDFDDINYALIESESALISEVIVTY